MYFYLNTKQVSVATAHVIKESPLQNGDLQNGGRPFSNVGANLSTSLTGVYDSCIYIITSIAHRIENPPRRTNERFVEL